MEVPTLHFSYRKEAIPLVDAFDFHDTELNSALGRYDGDVYTHLYNWAKKAPRNRDQVEARTCRMGHVGVACRDGRGLYMVKVWWKPLLYFSQVHPTYSKYLKNLIKSKI